MFIDLARPIPTDRSVAIAEFRAIRAELKMSDKAFEEALRPMLPGNNPSMADWLSAARLYGVTEQSKRRIPQHQQVQQQAASPVPQQSGADLLREMLSGPSVPVAATPRITGGAPMIPTAGSWSNGRINGFDGVGIRQANGNGIMINDTSGLHARTSEEIVKLSGLNWTVSKRNISVDGNPDASDHRAIVRDDTNTILGIVGSGAEPVQNIAAFRPFDSITETGSASYVGAGSFDEGRIVFAQAAFNHSAEIVPGDRVDRMLLISNGHGGAYAYSVVETDVRVVCRNTFMKANKKGEKLLKAKHTKRVHARVADASDIIARMHAEAEKATALYRAMAQRQLKAEELSDFISAVVCKNDAAEATELKRRNRDRERDEIMELIESGMGADIPGVRGTLWGAFNAATEWAQHHAQTWKTENDRVQSVYMGVAADTSQRAMDAAIELLS